jgi:alkylation response protein AidB-like acyl-CoA dehydrogenase
LDYALAYAGERRQFGKPLLEQQSIRFKLAEMAVSISAARLLVYQAAVAKDEGAPDITLKSSMAKLFATESAQKVVDEALQIFGGNGVVVKEYPMERLYREVRSPRVYEGTSEIQKLIIAGQVIKGAPRIKEV